MTPPRLSRATRFAILLRLFAVQGSWNYETMLGNGIAFAIAPALRRLPGGRKGAAYKAAIARESGWFNAHPYLAAIAVGALARAELDGEPPERIERFRSALAGPLGSVGDQLVWAGWLPFCSVLALLAFGLGASPLAVVLLFLITYNAGHIALCIWALEAGWRDGLRVAGALGAPLLRRGPQRIAGAALVLGAFALPLAAARVARTAFCPNAWWIAGFSALALLVWALLVRARGRLAGWSLASAALAALTVAAVAR